jgi:hypothetical protein
MAIDWNTVIFNMLTIKGIYGREMYETWYKMTVMLQQLEGHLRPGRQVRRPGHGRRFPRRGLHGRKRARHPRALRGHGPGGHHHRHPGQGFGRGLGRLHLGRKEIVEWLRQRSRPYLFSNTLAPVIAATSLAVLDLIKGEPELRVRLEENSRYFRQAMTEAGFTLAPGEHPIIPVMLGDAVLAQRMAARLLEEGIYVIGFSFPVVPQGRARIRTQISAAHTREDLEFAVEQFARVKQELEL